MEYAAFERRVAQELERITGLGLEEWEYDYRTDYNAERSVLSTAHAAIRSYSFDR